MKNKLVLTTFKSVMVFMFILLIIPIHAFAWSLKEVGLSDIEIDEENKIRSYTIHFEVDSYLAQAKGYIGIQKVPFIESYEDNSYGDFTDFGKVAEERFTSLSDITSNTDFISKYKILDFSSDNGVGFPVFGIYDNIDREFNDLDIQLYENGTYYVYLWTHYRGILYPDALVGTIEFDGAGKISVNDSKKIEEKIYYTLKYETNGGSKIASKSILSGAKTLEPDDNPTREGYTFDGWYSDDLLETPFDFNTNVTDNTTIYAKWNEIFSFKGYDGFYDGKSHSIIIDGELDGYTISYSLDGENYDLSEAPKYTSVGKYTIYYKATKEGQVDITGNVKINIKDSKQEENPETGVTLPVISFIFLSVLGGVAVFASKKNKPFIN